MPDIWGQVGPFGAIAKRVIITLPFKTFHTGEYPFIHFKPGELAASLFPIIKEFSRRCIEVLSKERTPAIA